METNTPIKVVYVDDRNVPRILKGKLVSEDEFTLTIQVEADKTVIIGKRFLLKASNIRENESGGGYNGR